MALFIIRNYSGMMSKKCLLHIILSGIKSLAFHNNGEIGKNCSIFLIKLIYFINISRKILYLF